MGCAAETRVAAIERDKLGKGIKRIYRNLQLLWSPEEHMANV
jgi:hypothetical protein